MRKGLQEEGRRCPKKSSFGHGVCKARGPAGSGEGPIVLENTKITVPD